MKEYKGIIEKIIKDSFYEVLVIDVFDDKIFKYKNVDNDFKVSLEISYQEYLSKCSEFILEDDISSYVDSLSLSMLEQSGNKISLNYKMINELGGFSNYSNNIFLYELDGKKIIVALVSKLDDNQEYKKESGSNSKSLVKLKKMTDSVGLAFLKIHNIINNDINASSKKEYIESILSSITTEFPEFNEALSDNAMSFYDNGKKTIMIIDDDKMTCSLIKKVFDNNYDVIVAHDGKEAIDYLSDIDSDYNYKNNISCIFLDLLMPVLDGFSVLDYLNDNNYLSKMPVIIISGNYDKETRNRAYSYQIADMLEKPFNVQVVRHRIENLINLYKSNNSINSMMLEQHKELKDIVNSLVVSYEIDNQICMNMVKKLTRLLTMQVSVDYPEYNINSDMIDKIGNSCCYFSIGNYTLPKSILYKKGLYTEEERSLIKMTNINGANIVKYVISKNNSDIDQKYAYEITKYFNERYDGNGYPEGLSGNSIPLAVQIASVVIEYTNLINTITPVDYERVASLIIMESGRKFSPKIVDSFKKVRGEFESLIKVGE